MKRNSLYNLLIVIFLFILLAIFFWESLTLKGVFITGDLAASDIMDQNYPMRNFLKQSLENKILPLWNPYIFCGFPSFAEGQGGFFYPLNLLLFYFLPSPVAYNYSVILTFLLAGIFTFIYARSIRLSKFASLFAGITFMFSGFFVTRLKHINMINAACWLPLIFFLIEKYFQKKKFPYLISAGMVWALQILAGHFEIAYYSVIGFSLYFLFRLCLVYKEQKKFSSLIKMGLNFFWVILIGVGISAIQLLPTYEYSKHSIRAEGVSYQEATMWTYSPSDLTTLIFPYYYGDPAKGNYQGKSIFWENCAYVGFLPLFFAFLTLFVFLKKNNHLAKRGTSFSGTRRYMLFFLFIFFLSLLVIMKRTFPVFKIFWNFVPGFRLFRFQQRFLLLVEFSLALLGGFGFDFLSQKFKLVRENGFKILVILITVSDLFIFGIKHNPTINIREWFSKPETVEFLEKDKSLYRIYSFGHFYTWPLAYQLAKGWQGDFSPYLGHRKVLPENFNMVYNIFSAGGYTSLFLRRFSQFENLIWKNVNLFSDGRAIFSENGIKLLSLLNVKYLPTLWDLQSNQLILRMETDFYPQMPKVKIYENKQFVPRIFLVPQNKFLTDEQQILFTLNDKNFNLQETVIIEENINHGSSSIEDSSVKMVQYSPQEIKIKTILTADGFLVLSDTNYPGWEVYVNGKKEKILTANYIMRAVALNKGIHEIRFIYQPLSFKRGWIISLIALVMSTFLILACLLKR